MLFVSPLLNLLFNFLIEFQQSGLAISKKETGGREKREKCCQGNSNPIIFLTSECLSRQPLSSFYAIFIHNSNNGGDNYSHLF